MPALETTERNRLTTGHLLLWMLGTAIVLACYRGLDRLPVEGSRLGLLQSLNALGNGLALGLSVGGALLWLLHTVTSRGGFPTQPGHWLLLVRGIATLVSLTGSSLRAFWGQEIAEVMFEGRKVAWIPVLLVIVLQLFPSSLAGAVGYWAALRSRSVEGVWRWAIGGLFGYTALNAVNSGLGLLVWLMEGQTESLPQFTFLAVSWGGLLLPLINLVVVVAAVRDPLNRERDFLHWAGVASLLATTALQLAFQVAIRQAALR